MATISTVRDAIKTTLEAAITGLRVFDTVPGSISPPVAVVFPERGSLRTLGAVKDSQQYRIQIAVGPVSERTAQDTLDGYLSVTGSTSICAAIKATPSLGVAGIRAVFEGWENYGKADWNGVIYLGVDVLVTVEN